MCARVGRTDGLRILWLVDHVHLSLFCCVRLRLCPRQQKELPEQALSLRVWQVVPAHRKLLAMYNNCVAVLDMSSLRIVEDKYAVTKNIYSLCRDSAADVRSHHFHVTAARKKGLYQFEVQSIMSPQKGARDLEDDRFRDVVSMARDGSTMAIAQRGPSVGGRGVYSVVNLRTGDVTSLFDFPDQTLPLVKYVSHNEVSDTDVVYRIASSDTAFPPVPACPIL